jgi:Mn-dependent DtxR family transcriptional regulator
VTKLDALNRLATSHDLTAGALAEELGTSMEASGMMLIRLLRQGLVERELDAGIFMYNLTPKGHARCVFLNAQTSEITG